MNARSDKKNQSHYNTRRPMVATIRYAPVAQLDRAAASYAAGRTFKSSPGRHFQINTP